VAHDRLRTRTALLPKASTTPSNPSYHSPNLANLRVNARVARASRVLVCASRANRLFPIPTPTSSAGYDASKSTATVYENASSPGAERSLRRPSLDVVGRSLVDV